MASPRDIKAGKAFVSLGVEDSKFRAGLLAAQAKLQAFGRSVSMLGSQLMGFGLRLAASTAALLAPLGAAVRLFSNVGDDLEKMSRRTGVAVEALSELGFAAEQEGADLESLEQGLRRMQRTLGDAATGSKSAVESLAKLGLTIDELSGLSPDKQFERIADALAGVSDPTMRAALAMEVFGRSGTNLLPLVENGAAGIAELREQARALGLTVSTETAAQAALLNDTLNILGRVARMGAFVIGGALAPTVVKLANAITNCLMTVNDFIRQHQQLIVTIASVGGGVLAVAAGIFALGLTLKIAGFAIGGFAAVLGLAAGALKLVGIAAAFIVSPLGIAIAAVVALGAAFLTLTETGRGAVRYLVDQFKFLGTTITATWGGIVDAIAAGDLGLAGQVAIAGLRVAWEQGTLELRKLWEALKGGILKTWEGVVHGLLAGWEHVVFGIKVAWAETIAFLKKLWADFSAGVQSAWEITVNWTSKRAIDAMELAGQLTPEEAEAAKADLQQRSDQRLGEIGQQNIDARQQAEQDRTESREQTDREFVENVAAIGQAFEDAIAAIDAAGADRISKARAELEAAKQQLDALTRQAAEKRAERMAEVAGIERPEGAAPPDVEDIAARISAGLEQMKIDLSPVGTFNATRTDVMFGRGANKMEQLSEQQLKEQQEMRRLLSILPTVLSFS